MTAMSTTISSFRKSKPKRLFIDIDGTLAEFQFGTPFENLFKEGYFLNLGIQKRIATAIKIICLLKRLLNVEIYSISSYLEDSKYALNEKEQWLNRNVPFIRNRIFLPCGDKKFNHVPCFNPGTDILIDDYGVNCMEWKSEGGDYIKVSVNGADLLKEQKKHNACISPDMSVLKIVITIIKSIKGGNAYV